MIPHTPPSHPRALFFLLLSLLPLPITHYPFPLSAQITPDGTVGTTVIGGPNFTIDGGTRPSGGPNLFHSFSQFSVPTGGSATFNNAPDVVNIINRVTGGSVSSIDGLIRANGTANLFLINPAGIVFGPNARLNIGGSFIGSTAHSLKFSDGTEFSAVNPAPPLLTINVPIGLQMGTNPAPITVQGSALSVAPGQTLGLIGGDLQIQGGLLTTSGGRMEIGSLAQSGTVAIDPNTLAANYTGLQTFGAVDLSQGAFLDLSGDGAGSLNLQASNLSLREGSLILANTTGNNNGGKLIINTTDRVDILDDTSRDVGIASIVAPGATGNGADIMISTDTLNLEKGYATIFMGTYGDGNSGNLDIQARTVRLNETAYIYAGSYGKGQGGNITIRAMDSVELLNGIAGGRKSGIYAHTAQVGNGGNIAINTDQLILDKGGEIDATAFGGSSGNVGNMDLQVRTLQVLNGSFVNNFNYGSGNGGHLNIAAKESIEVSGSNLNDESGIYSGTWVDGKGGDITVQTPDLLIDNGAKILMGTLGTADAGTVTVTTDRLRLDNSGGFPDGGHIVSSSFGGTGNAGRVNVKTRTLQMFNGAFMATDTFGPGNAGYLHIQATESIEMSGASPTNYATALFSGSNGGQTPSSGSSGTIWVETPSLIMRDRSYMRASLIGSGDAGNIIIKTDTIVAENSALIAENGTGRTSQAGRLDITANQVRLDHSTITTQTSGQGEANPITINAQNLQLLNRSILSASTTNQGNASNVDITANTLAAQNSDITSESTGSGNAGAVNLNVRDRITANDALFSTLTWGTGAGGQLSLNTTDLVANQSFIYSLSLGAGNAGTLDLRATDFQINDTKIRSDAYGTGSAGSITLTGNTLALSNQARISSNSEATGNAGQLHLNLRDRLSLDNSTLSTRTVNGAGGRIQLTASQLALNNNSLIDSSTLGTGNAGAIQVTTETTHLNHSTISSQSFGSGSAGTIHLSTHTLDLDNDAALSSAARRTGQAGNLNLQAQRTTLLNGSQITTSSTGTGNGGTVNLTGDTLTVRNGSSINASTASGNGGNIHLNLSGLLYLRDLSQISAEAGGTGNGGNIDIRALFLVGWGNSDIIANAVKGRGGNINITTEGIFWLKFRPFLTPDNDITASSQFGLNGSVQINTLALDPSSGLVQLPATLEDASRKMASLCEQTEGSSFVYTGRGGLPYNPLGRLESPMLWDDLRDLSAFQNQPPVAPPSRQSAEPTVIVEANAWRVNAQGVVELYAAGSEAVPIGYPVNCAKAPRTSESQR